MNVLRRGGEEVTEKTKKGKVPNIVRLFGLFCDLCTSLQCVSYGAVCFKQGFLFICSIKNVTSGKL